MNSLAAVNSMEYENGVCRDFIPQYQVEVNLRRICVHR